MSGLVEAKHIDTEQLAQGVFALHGLTALIEGNIDGTIACDELQPLLALVTEHITTAVMPHSLAS